VELATSYYQPVTDFYEYGWGQSFHFAPRRKSESLRGSLLRYEHGLAQRLDLRPGMSVLDVGCGVGGPMRNIARFSGANVTGISIAPYHIERGRKHNQRQRLENLCSMVQGDFNAMSFPDASFDGAYTIDACCYAANRRGPFGEVFRVLKPGSLFVGSDWCMTSQFTPGNPEHERIKLGIEKGDGIAQLVPATELDAALRDSGFEVLETRNLALDSDPETPWYAPLRSGFSLSGFRNSRLGALITHQFVRVLEATRLSPKGTVQVHDVLRTAQRALVEGGTLGIFTPLYYWVARKP
jgi:sterol 24-C-methyltransferase